MTETAPQIYRDKLLVTLATLTTALFVGAAGKTVQGLEEAATFHQLSDAGQITEAQDYSDDAHSDYWWAGGLGVAGVLSAFMTGGRRLRVVQNNQRATARAAAQQSEQFNSTIAN